MIYTEFLERKKLIFTPIGKKVQKSDIHPMLFEFQKDLVRWALQKGRAAIFADTGLGKTFMQLEWSRLSNQKTLIVAPLSVSRQTMKEASKIDIDVKYVRSQEEVEGALSITNYERIEHFDADYFGAIVLDESSILKAIGGKTKAKIIEMFALTPFKLACTATPAPNDITEIANHAEFLGVMSRQEMLSAFFIHDSDGWRLKKHAEEPFYRWLASWGMAIKKPSNLGYTDDGYILPKLNVKPLFVKTDYQPEGTLFFMGMKGIQDRSRIRKGTMSERIIATANLVMGDNDQWIVWCGLNDEADRIADIIPGAVNVQGSDSNDKKMKAIEDFQDGKIRVLVTKPKIAGFGMNFQNAHKMAFLGLNDSWENYYQCIRRSWRFGQKDPVDVYIVLSDIEVGIYNNVMRKEAEAAIMSEKLIENVKEFEKADISDITQDWEYKTKEFERPGKYRIMLGDCTEKLKEVSSESVGLSVFSPPFMSLYTYSPTERDLGNSKTEDEFFAHFDFIIEELLRVTMPGRNCAVHVSNIASTVLHDGFIGLKDFRGDVIRAFQKAGWIYHGEVTIDKNPQVQAIRTHAKGLLFAQKDKDSSWLRPALADYIVIFRKPGENPVPIKSEISNEEWIEYARPVWYGIKETDVLNASIARENKDERHICPLQLGTIERCIKLWSNKNDVVLSPFMGIGSEGFKALQLGRQFIGIELKESYFNIARKNLEEALHEKLMLF